MWPFLFQDVDKDEVEFVNKGTIVLQALFRVRIRDNAVDDEIADA